LSYPSCDAFTRMRSEGVNSSARQAPAGEPEFLEALLQFTRSARKSSVPSVAKAAREWEPVLTFRIRVSLQERERRKRHAALRLEVTAPAGPSNPEDHGK